MQSLHNIYALCCPQRLLASLCQSGSWTRTHAPVEKGSHLVFPFSPSLILGKSLPSACRPRAQDCDIRQTYDPPVLVACSVHLRFTSTGHSRSHMCGRQILITQRRNCSAWLPGREEDVGGAHWGSASQQGLPNDSGGANGEDHPMFLSGFDGYESPQRRLIIWQFS